MFGSKKQNSFEVKTKEKIYILAREDFYLFYDELDNIFQVFLKFEKKLIDVKKRDWKRLKKRLLK